MAPQETGFYKAFWLEYDRIVFVELIGYFDTDLLNEAHEHVRRTYIEAGVSPVHVVMDVKGLTRYPKPLTVVEEISDTLSSAAGWVMLIGFDNPLTTSIARMAPQIFGMGLKRTDTLREAFNTLRELDTTLSEAH